MFWALQKRREELERARREGYEEGVRLGRQSVLDKLEEKTAEEDTETLASTQGKEENAGPSSLWQRVETVRAGTRQEPGMHRFYEVPGIVPPTGVSVPYSLGPAMSPTSVFSPFTMVDWNVSTPSGNKTIAFVPDLNGGFKAILIDPDPVGMPQ